MKRFLVLKIFLGLHFYFYPYSDILGNPILQKVYKEESIRQGTILWNQAREYCYDQLWQNCMESIQTFLILYPFHPSKWEARELLSLTFIRMGMLSESAELDKTTYLENPTHPDAKRAFLRAGRTYVKIGEYSMAKKIFEELREYSFDPEIAKEADLELRQWSVLSGNTRQIQENL